MLKVVHITFNVKRIINKQSTSFENGNLALMLTCNVDHQKMLCVVSYYNVCFFNFQEIACIHFVF